MPTDNDYLRQIARLLSAGAGGLTVAQVTEAIENALLSTVAYSGAVSVGGSSVSLPDNALGYGLVWVQLPFDATASVFVGGTVDSGHQLLPGEKTFFPVSNTNLIELVAPVSGYDSVTVYWWAS